ncbi:MAG: OB-fold nucleic acid binding domain-containing protein [Candidatus Aenigmarchaeota archaeon]
MISRQTAKKTRVWDIMSGSFVKKEGFEPSFVKTQTGEEISRAHILGTVVSKFVADDGNYASVTIDDGSDTIRLKVFKTTKPLDSLEVGDIVDVVGKVREYEGETYVIPEIARKIEDHNFELLRRLELIQKERGMKKVKDLVEKNKGKDPEELKKELTEKHGIEKQSVDVVLGGGEEDKEKRILKKEILQVIESSPDGIVYSELAKNVKAEETELESAIDELLNDGICYEPSPGKIRKI